jgi:hypothetical protein
MLETGPYWLVSYIRNSIQKKIPLHSAVILPLRVYAQKPMAECIACLKNAALKPSKVRSLPLNPIDIVLRE